MNLRLTAAQFQAQFGHSPPETPSKAKAQIRIPRRRAPNKTEAAYGEILKRTYGPGFDVLYEPFSFNLPSGTRYTADWIVLCVNTIIEVVETKGPHIHSAASIRAFKEALAAYPKLKFTFAQKTKDGWATA